MTPDEVMQVAVDAARRGIFAGQSPFGCAIEREGRIIAACHNTVLLSTDITAHAEINALREACRRTGQIHLEGAVVATTCEPCPMCMSALHWARVDSVYYGATIGDAAAAGFNELRLSAQDVLTLGASHVKLHRGGLEEACQQLFKDWLASDRARAY